MLASTSDVTEGLQAMSKTETEHGRFASRRRVAQSGAALYCVPCQQPFASVSNLMCHLRHIHGRHADHLYYSGSPICPACGLNYHCMGRVLTHLKTVPKCWQAVKAAGFVGDVPHHGEGSRLRKQERAAHPNLVPAVPAVGPRVVYDDGGVGGAVAQGKVCPGLRISYRR